MIDWKHPELVVKTAAYLKEHLEEIPFHITMIGGGELEEEVHSLAEELGVTDKITFAGFRSPEEVRAAMEESEIYLVTSDRKEGWGAVVNEAMNSGCAVVAGHAAGSVPYLLRDGENGLLYPSGDTQALYRRIRLLLDDPGLQQRLGSAAYRTVTRLWSPEEAARRLLLLAEHILAGEESPVLFEDGPCSPAPLLRDDWYRAKE